MTDIRANIYLYFLLSFLVLKLTPKKSVWNHAVTLKKFTFCSHIPALCSSCITTPRICNVFAFTLISIVQNYLKTLWCLVTLTTAIHICLVSHSLTLLNFSLLRSEWLLLRWSHHNLLTVFHCCIPFTAYQSNLELILRYDCWPAKLFVKSNLFLFHSVLATSLPSRSVRSNKGITLLIPWVKTNSGARAFHSRVPSLWNNPLLSVQSATSIVTFGKHLKTQFVNLAFSP